MKNPVFLDKKQEPHYTKIKKEIQELKKRKEFEMLKKFWLISGFLFDDVFTKYVKSNVQEEYLVSKLKEILSENEVVRYHLYDRILKEYGVKMYNECFEKALSLESEFLKIYEDKSFQGKYSYVAIVKRSFNLIFPLIYEIEYNCYLNMIEGRKMTKEKELLEKIYKLERHQP